MIQANIQTMQVSNNPLTLFDFIGDKEKADTAMNELSKRSDQNIVSDMQAFESGLNQNQFEETLKQIEQGELDVDLATIGNYLSFNIDRLESALGTLQDNFNLEPPLAISIENDTLILPEHDDKDRIQRYLERDDSINKLITQTSKLSQFVEWAQAKEQAGTFKEEGMSESELVNFLKSARTVVTQPNTFIVSNEASLFSSENHTKDLIDKNTVEK